MLIITLTTARKLQNSPAIKTLKHVEMVENEMTVNRAYYLLSYFSTSTQLQSP